MSDEPRAYTTDEARYHFLCHLSALSRYWAKLPDKTKQERLDGLVHSILNVFDGTSGGMCALDLVLCPHPSDKEFHQSEGSNWYEPGLAINGIVHMHKEWFEVARSASNRLASPAAGLRIIAAAVQVDGVTLSMPPPARHYQIVNTLCGTIGAPENTRYAKPEEQGFLTSEGHFVGRQKALAIARAAGQLLKESGLPELYTEDLW